MTIVPVGPSLQSSKDRQTIVRMDVTNYGSGSQYVKVGGGTQNVNAGQGNQYNAQNINFGKRNHGHIHKMSSNANVEVAATDTSHEDRNKAFLEDLMLSDPRLDKDRIIRTNGHLLKDSYRWILKNETFQKWQAGKGSRLLWVRGDPGKGKTMLLCGIIEELQRQDPKCRLVYFFCQATDAKLNTANAVLRGLLYSMIKDKPDMIKDLRENHHGRQLFEDANGWDVLCRMITRLLTNNDRRGTTIIIDALDECTKDRNILLDFIVKLPSTSAKVIVSSRNWPIIERGLGPAAREVAHLSLELNEHLISVAVIAFIEHRVDQLATAHEYDSATKSLVHKYLVEKASDTFLWAALASRQLADINLDNWDVESKLKEFPAGLEELYARMLDQVTKSKASASLLTKILAIALIAFRPVKIPELKHLLGSPGEKVKDGKSLEKAVMQCGSFLTVKDDVVYFVHQSAKDYLSERASHIIMPDGSVYEHSLLCSNSLQAMSMLLRRDIHNLKAPGVLADEIKGPITKLVPLQYSCRFWIDHLCLSEPEEDRQYAEVEQFMRHSFLHWLEAMSLMKSVFESIRCIANLSRIVQVRWFRSHGTKYANYSQGRAGCSQLASLVQDAYRFIQYHRQGISNAPLQVYHSALIFSPIGSVIRGLYQHEEPEWLVSKPLMQETWGPLLQLLGPHSDSSAYAKSVAFSVDGKTIASISSNCINSWDAMTGQSLRAINLRGISPSTTILSPNGTTMASASHNKVLIWNVETGQLLRELEGHLGEVHSLDYSKDGSQLLSSSSDHSIKLWNPTTGQCIRTFYDGESHVIAVFLPHDQKIVSTSTSVRASDYSLKVWTVATGRCTLTTAPHSSPQPDWVSILQDGNTLVVACEGRNVDVWDTSLGKCVRTFKNICSSAVNVSRSTRLLVFLDGGNRHIQIWDIDTGRELGMIVGLSEGTLSLTFSPDGTRLAAISGDNKIRLLDLTTFLQKQLTDSAIVPGVESKGLSSKLTAGVWVSKGRKRTSFFYLHAVGFC